MRPHIQSKCVRQYTEELLQDIPYYLDWIPDWISHAVGTVCASVVKAMSKKLGCSTSPPGHT